MMGAICAAFALCAAAQDTPEGLKGTVYYIPLPTVFPTSIASSLWGPFIPTRYTSNFAGTPSVIWHAFVFGIVKTNSEQKCYSFFNLRLSFQINNLRRCSALIQKH